MTQQVVGSSRSLRDLLELAISAHRYITMFRTAARQAASKPPNFNIYTNPYRAKKTWPPDFTKLSEKHQFRLERRYRRRCKLKWARPRWNQGVKLFTLGTVGCEYLKIRLERSRDQLRLAIVVIVYAVLFMDWKTMHTPFDGVS